MLKPQTGGRARRYQHLHLPTSVHPPTSRRVHLISRSDGKLSESLMSSGTLFSCFTHDYHVVYHSTVHYSPLTIDLVQCVPYLAVLH